MMRIIYSSDGHSARDATPMAIDVRDLDVAGRPHPSLLPVGEKIGEVADVEGNVTYHLFDHVAPTKLGPGERAFDHMLSEAEREREFPGYGARVKGMARVAAVRTAVAMAAHDDELAAVVAGGTLNAADLSDLAQVNARRKLRGKEPIA